MRAVSVLSSCQVRKSTVLIKVTYAIALQIFEDICYYFNAPLIVRAVFDDKYKINQ